MNARRKVTEGLFQVTKHIAALIAARRFDDVVALTGGARLSAAAMKTAVSQYPGTLVPLPDDAIALLDAVPISGTDSTSWNIVQPLFTAEEGRSDLSLLLTITANANGGYVVCVDDIHVL